MATTLRVQSASTESPSISAPSTTSTTSTRADWGYSETYSLAVDESSREVFLDGTLIDLTRTEFDLLSLLSRHPRHVFSARRIQSELWSTDFFSGPHAVEAHISRLRLKLGETGLEPRFIHTVRGVGYRFEPGPGATSPPSPVEPQPTVQFELILDRCMRVIWISRSVPMKDDGPMPVAIGDNFLTALDLMPEWRQLMWSVTPIEDHHRELVGYGINADAELASGSGCTGPDPLVHYS